MNSSDIEDVSKIISLGDLSGEIVKRVPDIPDDLAPLDIQPTQSVLADKPIINADMDNHIKTVKRYIPPNSTLLFFAVLVAVGVALYYVARENRNGMRRKNKE